MITTEQRAQTLSRSRFYPRLCCAHLVTLFALFLLFPCVAIAQSAFFLGSDPFTQGNWQGVYGIEGYNVSQDGVSYPSYATVSLTGQGNRVWDSSSPKASSLQKAASPSDRIAACWFSEIGASGINGSGVSSRA